MSKVSAHRRARWHGMVERLTLLLTLALLGAAPAFADDWVPTIGTPLASQCPITQPPVDPGSDPGLPGIWYNPKRGGSGWELNFVPVPNQPNVNALDVVWLTFDAGRRPVWLSNAGTTVHSVSGGAETFKAPLYRATLVNNEQFLSLVGEVAVTFVPDSTTQAVVWWKWNAIDSTVRKECIYNWFKGQTPSNNGTDGAVNEAYTGLWGSGLWSFMVNVNTSNVQQTTEVEYVGIFDAAGQPVWMMSDPIYGPQTGWTQKNLSYVKSTFPGGYPLTDCAACYQQTFGLGTIGRSFTSSTVGTASLTANVSAAMTGGVEVAWSAATAPSLNFSAMSKVTVNRTTCSIASGTMCAIAVSWMSANGADRIYRRNLTTNQLSTTPLSASSSGSYTDPLGVDSDVQYEMHRSGSTGALIYKSPEVKVTLDPASVPTCTGATPSDGTSPLNGLYRLYAYGVTSATSVQFSTWWVGSNQADMHTFQGVDEGNGTWHSDIDLAYFDPGTPRYGGFGTYVTLVQGSQSALCATIGWNRPLPPPSIASFSPASGHAGVSVTLTGQNFSGTLSDDIVKFNGVTATVTAATLTSVVATVPVGATTGPISIAINGQMATSATPFTIVPAPNITGVSPLAGPIGQPVTLTGTGFSTTPSSNVVTFNGIQAVVSTSTATSIATSVPVGATTGPVRVVVGGQSSTYPTYFVVTVPTSPYPPTAVTVPASVNSASFNVGWTPSTLPPAATSFAVERASSGSGPWLLVGTQQGGTNSITTTVPTSGTYYFRVAACTTVCSAPTNSGAVVVTIPTLVGEAYYFHHTNLQGSVVATSDVQANIIAASNFRPFGQRFDRPVGGSFGAVNPPQTHLGFTGKWHDDELQLDYFGARYYDANTSRFLGLDPAGFVQANAHSFNQYVYGNNNPNKYIDPDGRAPKWIQSLMGQFVEPSSISASSVHFADNIRADAQHEIDTAPEQAADAAKLAATAFMMAPLAEIVEADAAVLAVAETSKPIVGTAKAWASGAKPNSVYVQVHPTMTDKAIQSTVYNAEGKAVGQIDWKTQHGVGPGHGHGFGTPGDFSTRDENYYMPGELPDELNNALLPSWLTPIH